MKTLVFLRGFVLLAAVSGLSLARAQIASTAPASGASPNDDPVLLSPFSVVADDKGYQAFNTLAGTRLNSKLEDLGSSITVVTLQQMQDTAVLDINDLFRYEASTEGTDDFTQFTPNRTGGVGDNIQNDPARANRIRGVGSAGTSGSGVNSAWGNFQSNSKIPFDLYNVGAIEISRGPNSNLFGLGASAGTVNLVPAEASATKPANSFTFRVDSEGGHRTSLSLNRPLISGKLAIKVAAVEESKGFTRKPSSERIHREYVSLFARPFKSTSIRASAERYSNVYRRPNSLTPRDTSDDWKAAGSPTWDPLTQMVTLGNGSRIGPFTAAQDATLPAGLQGGGNIYGSRIAIVEDSKITSFSVGRISNPITTGTPSPLSANGNIRYLETASYLMRNKANLFPLFFEPATNNKAIYDWSKINYVASNNGRDHANTFMVQGEQIFLHTPTHTLAARAGWFRQEFRRQAANFIDNTDSVIYVDVNERLLDGRPNPNFKRPYFQALGAIATDGREISDTQTADLAYQFTPSKLPRWLGWIGSQRFGSHAEVRRADNVSYRASQLIADDHAWTNRANRVSTGAIVQRYYVGDSQGQNIDYSPSPIKNISGSYPLHWFNNLTGQWVDEPTVVDNLGILGTTRNRDEIRTINATAQSFFFNDRLVTTFGWRKDRRRERTSLPNVIDPATGLVSYEPLKTWGRWTDDQGDVVRDSQRGQTRTFGAVLKPLRWLNLHYNQSDSFFPQVVRQQLDLKSNIPNPSGVGKDYGFSFTALQGKLNVKINRYQVTEYDSRGSEVGTIGNRTIRLEGRQEANGVRDANGFYPWAEELVRSRLAAQGNANPTQAQLRPAIAQVMGQTEEWLNIFLDSGLAQPQTVGTTDVTSKGIELEATYNPTRNWRIKFTGAQGVAYDAAISPEVFNYWQSRLPVWTTARGDSVPGNGDGKGALWWTTVPARGGNTPEAQYNSGLISPYLVGVANVGKPRTQVREYRWNALTNYEFSEGRLKGFSVGGGVRWLDKGSIGFLGKAPQTSGPFTGAILELDKDKPVWDKARFYYDFSAGYRFRFHGDKIRARVQLNIKDVFEKGRLQPVGVNPDGSYYAFRIIDPRRFILSASFDL
ncbi:MAG: TonB-dependent receptor plug domain-containing protein [Opitutaceae bacterium]|nr:TonB-dependent receptor plug domain-containing protein [Opitutaceae bacterium]